MTSLTQSSCVFCRRPTPAQATHLEHGATDVDCDNCGKYRVSRRAEKTMIRFSSLSSGAWFSAIGQANARGYRLSIPGGVPIPL